MPGKNTQALHSYITAMRLHRSVAAADVSIADVPSLDLSIASRTDAKNNPMSIGQGANARLLLGVLLGDGVTGATVAVFGNLAPAGVDLQEPENWSGNWVLLESKAVTASALISLDGVYPGEVKIVVSSITGAGNVHIAYSRTE
jgi:hypothetical protein